MPSDIQYPSPLVGGQKSSAFKSEALAHIINLAEDYSASSQINILNEDGATAVLTDEILFNDFTARLSEGADDFTGSQLQVLAKNSREVLLRESYMSGMNPIAALSLPMLRVTYPKLAVREGIPTLPVENPLFRVPTKRPYVIDNKTGEKVMLPGALSERGDLFQLPKLADTAITLTEGTVQDHDLLSGISKNWKLGDKVDTDFRIVSVKIENKDYPVDFQLAPMYNIVRGDIKLENDKTVTIVATVDRDKGKMSVMSVGEKKPTEIKVLGYVSSEANNATTQVGFDITAEEITIPTGHPIESPINIQHMTDVMAMYRVDATISHLETMSTVLAQSIDLKGVAHIEQAFQRDPSIVETFNTKPPVNYHMGESQWREELKLNFDRVIIALQDRTRIYDGHAVVFAHPMDAAILSNVRWSYSSETGQSNAVSVSYRLGTFTSGTTTYTLLQSPHFKRGEFSIVYIPAEDDLRTTMYFPYSFNTIRGAASPNTPNIPSIQMIQRSVFHTFTPMVAKIKVINKDHNGKNVADFASVDNVRTASDSVVAPGVTA